MREPLAMSSPSPVLAPDVALELNPLLDRRALAQSFARATRLHIPDVLTQPSAVRLLQALQQETSWTVTLNKGQNFLDFEKMPPDERGRLAVGVFERARAGGFHYIYDTHRISRAGEPYNGPVVYLGRLFAFLNSANFLAFMREVTGLNDIAFADAQATLYRPGDFLTTHDDKTGGHKRRAAYVLNMTPGWCPDWGGILQFFDERGNVSQGFVPAFNALNVFRVPAEHAVSQVALFGGFRYSVTGWLHAR